MLVYTSITKNYLPKARVLSRSLKRHNPGWRLCVILCDTPPENFDLRREPFDDLLTLAELGVPNWKSWAFGHNVVELCTAVKGVAAQRLAGRGGEDRLIYLDPDIMVFSSLEPLAELLERHQILLTPHLLEPETDAGAVIDNEICTLRHGVYNLGFVGVRTIGEGRRFIDWWAARLAAHCVADPANGLFTDQRWVDLAPGFFDGVHVLRDKGCNVATWNLHHRVLAKNAAGVLEAGGETLRFYHFTGFDSGDGRGVLLKYAADQIEAHLLWDGYAKELRANGHGEAALNHFAYGCFDNGVPIDAALRRAYRMRRDLQEAFPDPFRTGKWSLQSWWREEQRGVGLDAS
jgi:hypothetical protein